MVSRVGPRVGGAIVDEHACLEVTLSFRGPLVDPPHASNGLAKIARDFWEQYRRNGGTIDFGF